MNIGDTYTVNRWNPIIEDVETITMQVVSIDENGVIVSEQVMN